MEINKKSLHNIMEKPVPTTERQLLEHVIEAIAYMEYQPSTKINVKCRKQLREVAKYLKDAEPKKKLSVWENTCL